MPEPRTAEQIAEKLRRDSKSIERYRDALLCAGVDTDDMADEEVVERTARMIVFVLEFSRKMKPVMEQIGGALQRINVVFQQYEQNSPAFAALVAAERQRTVSER